MPTPANLVAGIRIVMMTCGTRGLPDRLCQGDKIVVGRRRRTEVTVMPNEIPPAWSRQAHSVVLAQVI